MSYKRNYDLEKSKIIILIDHILVMSRFTIRGIKRTHKKRKEKY